MLQVKQLVKHFDGVKAVDGVSFGVSRGECVALIGPNGAGKSTCFACIAGQYKPTGGEVMWNTQALNELTPAARLQHGVARTFQVAQVFEALTVLQNVQLAVQAPYGRKAISAFEQLAMQSRDAAFVLLEKTGLATLAGRGVPAQARLTEALQLAFARYGVRGPVPVSHSYVGQLPGAAESPKVS